jgi:sugar (pentulose or hexulose) kinase
LTLSHGSAHLFRSIYEATAFGTRHIVEDLEKHGIPVQRLYAGGGGVRSRLWLQIHADVLRRPIYLPRDSEACALGSAMVAAVHAGAFRDLQAAAKEMVQIGGVVEPEVKNRHAYETAYDRYRRTYPALKSLMHDLANNG